MKALFAAALTALGLVRHNSAVQAAPDETPESMAAAIASATKVEVDAQVAAQVEARFASDPIYLAAKAAGLDSREKIETLQLDAALGNEYLLVLRAEVKAVAIVALGAEAGALKAELVDKAGADTLKLLKGEYEAIAEAKGFLSANGGTRETAPNQIDIAAGTAGTKQPVQIDSAKIYERMNNKAVAA